MKIANERGGIDQSGRVEFAVEYKSSTSSGPITFRRNRLDVFFRREKHRVPPRTRTRMCRCIMQAGGVHARGRHVRCVRACTHVKKRIACTRGFAWIRMESAGAGRADCTFFETQKSYEISRALGETFNAPR